MLVYVVIIGQLVDEGAEYVTDRLCDGRDLVLSGSNDPVESSQHVPVLVRVKNVANSAEQLLDYGIIHALPSDNHLTGSLALFEEQLIEASGGVRLVDLGLAAHELVDELDVVEHLMFRNLVPEHVDELQTGRLHDRKLVDVLLLQLRNNQLVQVIMQLRLLNSELDHAQPRTVVLNDHCDEQVQ